jgi:hypothetical protein
MRRGADTEYSEGGVLRGAMRSRNVDTSGGDKRSVVDRAFKSKFGENEERVNGALK